MTKIGRPRPAELTRRGLSRRSLISGAAALAATQAGCAPPSSGGPGTTEGRRMSKDPVAPGPPKLSKPPGLAGDDSLRPGGG